MSQPATQAAPRPVSAVTQRDATADTATPDRTADVPTILNRLQVLAVAACVLFGVITAGLQLLAGVQRGPTFGNARYVRNLLEAAIGRHAWRLREIEKPTLEQLRTLIPDDLDPVVEPVAAPPAAADASEPAAPVPWPPPAPDAAEEEAP